MAKKSKTVRTRTLLSQQPKRRFFWFVVIAIILAPLLIYGGSRLWAQHQYQVNQEEKLATFDAKIQLLEEKLLAETASTSSQALPEPSVVFISMTNTIHRAVVFTGTGNSVESAWQNVVSDARDYLATRDTYPTWIKADLVDSSTPMSQVDLAASLNTYRSQFFRKGVALDASFTTAFLEAELNGNAMIDYDNDALMLEKINDYQKLWNRPVIDELPEDVVVFTTKGWFCDEAGTVYPLYTYEEPGHQFGRRVVDILDRDLLENIIVTSSQWLLDEVQEDGSFVYGYYPMFNRKMSHYNLIRHTLAAQSLMWLYSMDKDPALIPSIESTLGYLVEEHVEYLDDQTAYVMDRPNEEVKLGGSGVAIIALKQYRDTFDDHQFDEICTALGRGILALMDEDNGSFYHVLNPDFSKKEAFRIVYYDGEAAYALALLYEMTGDPEWLRAAETAVDRFIRDDYVGYRDHWVAYAVNEVAKHSPKEEYLRFGLRNAQENLAAIRQRDTTFFTYLELLMATYELYHRMQVDGLPLSYASEFDDAAFIDTIFLRTEHMLNGFFYPEYSMYMERPDTVVGSVMTRHDNYRVRIDDVAHFIAGYYYVWQHYEQLRAYQAENE